MYSTMRSVCLFYLLPVEYVCLLLTSEGSLFRNDGLLQTHFLLTETLWRIALCIIAVWAVVTLQSFVLYMWRNRHVRQIFKGNIPEEDPVAMEEFARISRKLRIHRKIGLCRNDLIESPLVYGFFRPCVVLPYRKYTREQLVVIFYHELMHCKSHDVFYKWCCLYVQLTQHLNPLASGLNLRIDDWSEYHCDRKTIEALGDEMSTGRYFEVIVETAPRKSWQSDEEFVSLMLCESQVRLERRIEYMKRYQKATRRTKLLGAALAVMFVVLNVTTTYAAGIQLSKLHGKLFMMTENAVQEDMGEPPVEHYLPAEEDDWAEEDTVYAPQEAGLYNLEENEVVKFDWEVKSGTRYIGGWFDVEEGQYISVSAALIPSNVYCWVGIMDEANNLRYVSGYSHLGYNFEIVKSGKYRVFVHNGQKGSDVNAVGSYYFYTPEPETEEPEA